MNVSREEIKSRFERTLKKVANDQHLADEVRDRNILQKIFANETRDLARADIAQNEIIFELSKELQDAVLLIRQGQLRVEELTEIVDSLRASHEKSVLAFVEKFKVVLSALLTENGKIECACRNIESNTSRIDSGERAQKCAIDIRELAQKKSGRESSELLEGIVSSIKKRFSDVVLRNDDKRLILLAVKDADFPGIEDASGVILPFERMVESHLDSIANETERYVEYKEGLIGLIDDFVSNRDVVDPDGVYIGELLSTRKNLQESQFEIALVGEFQGGKSTTFNMLCGGREISPRGLNGGGIKTSAAVITAQNIDGNETKDGLTEWAEITWLSEDEIANRIKNVLSDYQDKTEDVTLKQLPQLIMRAWEKKPSGEMLDRLRIATLQSRVLQNGKYGEISSRTILPVDQFQYLVRFPEAWEKRWLKGFNSEFSTDEMLFACLDRVLVRLHAPCLARLGCRVTDCPGLFVSQWDTDRALEVMDRSHAIWYLLGGERQIGENDKRALTRIKDNKWEDKCFFSINFRKNERATLALLEEDRASLRALNFSSDRVFLYNAILSFRAGQFDVLSADNPPLRDIDCLAEETRRDDEPVEKVREALTQALDLRIKALKKLIFKQLNVLDKDDLADKIAENDRLSPCLIDEVRGGSHVAEIVSAIEKLIINRRAYAILVTLGSRKCTEVLVSLEQKLKRAEDTARQSVDEAFAEVEKVRNEFKRFKKVAAESFEFLKEDSFDEKMATCFFDEHKTELRTEIKKRAEEICKEEWSQGRLNTDVNTKTERRISEEFQALVTSKLNVCVQMNELKQNIVFTQKVLRPMEAALDKMRSDWKKLQSANDLLKGIEISGDISDVKLSAFTKGITGAIDVPSYSWEFLKDFITLGIRRLFQTPNDRIHDFFEKEDPVGTAFDQFAGEPSNRRDIVKFLGSPRRKLDRKIQEELSKMEKQLKRNIEDKEKCQQGTLDEKQKIAESSEDIRKKIVSPAKEKIAKFEQQVSNFYA